MKKFLKNAAILGGGLVAGALILSVQGQTRNEIVNKEILSPKVPESGLLVYKQGSIIKITKRDGDPVTIQDIIINDRQECSNFVLPDGVSWDKAQPGMQELLHKVWVIKDGSMFEAMMSMKDNPQREPKPLQMGDSVVKYSVCNIFKVSITTENGTNFWTWSQ